MRRLELHPDTLLATLQARAFESPELEAFRMLDGPSWTWSAWWRDALRIAAALVSEGVRPGDRVAILASNTPMWPIADVGILLAGAVSVGLFPTAAPAQVQEIVADASAIVALTDDADQLAKIVAVRTALPALMTLVSAAAAPGDAVRQWADWLADGEAILADPARREVLAQRAESIVPSQAAVLIYTSGSTGRAKGARLTHATLRASAESVATTLGLTAADRTLSFLPFCHAGERIFGHCTRMLTGMTAVLIPDAKDVWRAASTSAPTLFGGMPRFFEKGSDALSAAARGATGADAEQWARAERLGRQRSALHRTGVSVPPPLEAEWHEAVAIAAPVIRRCFGDSLRIATSGGAVLNAKVAAHLDAFGVTVLGAYGQTEHLCGTMHRPGAYGFDSVGFPMPGSEIRIASDGEILFHRSTLTFDGYHGLARETAEAFTPDGGWLRSGDLGELLPNGALRVTGRKKELIALATGKKVAPLPIESALEEEPFVAQALCVGEGRPYLAVLLTLRATRAEEWARVRGAAPAAAAQATDVLADIERAVARVNAKLSRAEQVKRWRLLPEEFSVERGELTPTQKVRRTEVAKLHRQAIDSLYR